MDQNLLGWSLRIDTRSQGIPPVGWTISKSTALKTGLQYHQPMLTYWRGLWSAVDRNGLSDDDNDLFRLLHILNCRDVLFAPHFILYVIFLHLSLSTTHPIFSCRHAPVNGFTWSSQRFGERLLCLIPSILLRPMSFSILSSFSALMSKVLKNLFYYGWQSFVNM